MVCVISVSKQLVSFLFFGVLLLNCFTGFGSYAQKLVADEVKLLREIAETLGKRDWNFSVDPCSGKNGWATPNVTDAFANNVTCNCSFSDGCHIERIFLKSLNLKGSLPPELYKFPYLQEIDLARNYLNGTIPPEWGSMKLVNISLYGNRLTGSIPKEFGNISTLKSLVLEYNQLLGNLPPELGNLSYLETLFLTSNNFTGEVPKTFAGLTTLKKFRISDNQFSGEIPDFIQNWTNLEFLAIQGSGLSGPIPSDMTRLGKLTDLRISDLNGSESHFPQLNVSKRDWIYLVLRSCNIIGPLPEYLGNMSIGYNIDLSFNKLSGEILGNVTDLKNTNNIYLTGNLLTGPVPEWLLVSRKKIDLSYNNFTVNDSNCNEKYVNLFTNSSTSKTLAKCLGISTCQKHVSTLGINCGGEKIDDNNEKITYYGDTADWPFSNTGGPSYFHNNPENWAFSNTGNFMDNGTTKTYILKNSSELNMANPELYMNARLSPLSLTYYAFCLNNGTYTVHLHFAEIMFTDDATYNSLGRRVFDIYIQGVLEQKDFNIANEAGGVRKDIKKTFTAVVTSNTLEIRLYWAGKGTTAIPYDGVYGPLISAISIINSDKQRSISVGTVVGIVVAGVFLLFLVLCILWWKGCLGQKNTMEQELKGLQIGSFTLRQIKAATNNFDAANKIGEGGFGSVFKGLLSDGTRIAVKQLSSKSKQGNREFVNEMGTISALQHPHLVKLYGCCIEGNELLLVYEYMENNSLARALFGPEEYQLKLDWPTRLKICVGIAKGLAYLHEESRLKIVHRDIKATNVLLDKYLNPKISDFGLAKLNEEENTHISTRVAGTFGYMAPEYAMRGYLTDKADVYSFGIVALEIVSGRSNTIRRPNEESFNLLDLALVLKEEGSLIKLLDQRLGMNYNEEEVMTMIHVALLCTNVSSVARPTMSLVVSMLEGRIVVPELVSNPSFSHDETKMKLLQQYYQHTEEYNKSETYTQSMSLDGTGTATSSSAADLYPISVNSSYLEKRN